MNCFQWSSRASEHLDGLLPPPELRQASAHLDTCADCSHKFEHFRRLSQLMGEKRRTPLPLSIRKQPTSWFPHKLSGVSALSSWERLPWIIRSAMEGFGVAFVVFAVIAMTPKIRELYERGLTSGMETTSIKDLLGDSRGNKDDTPTLVRGKDATDPAEPAPPEEFSSEGEGDEGSIISNDEQTIRGAEIWRFNLLTDSPHEIQPKITTALINMGVPKSTHGLGGTEAPGGIQFDLLVPSSIVGGLKGMLVKFVTQPSSNQSEGDSNAENQPEEHIQRSPFTWFRNRSKRPLPEGKTRIVIWLSQI